MRFTFPAACIGAYSLIKGLLAPNGLLALIEVTKATVFNTLTYGLLDGWWHFEDGHRRLPNAPLLSCDQWREALTEEGFRRVMAAEKLRQVTVGDLQSLVLAENDGSFLVTTLESSPVAAKTLGATVGSNHRPADFQKDLAPADQAESDFVSVEDQSAEREELQMLVEDRLTAVLREALRLEVSDFSNETSFEHLGIDSIVSVGIVETLNQVLGTQLRPVDLFNYSTIRSLSERILSVSGEVVRSRVGGSGCRREARRIDLTSVAEGNSTVAQRDDFDFADQRLGSTGNSTDRHGGAIMNVLRPKNRAEGL